MFVLWKEEHELELSRDFRVFYHASLFDIGLLEGYNLTQSLKTEPASHYAAKVNGWDYPISSTDILLWEISEILIMTNWDKKANGNFRRQRRPWDRFKRDDLIRGKLIPIGEAVKIYQVKTVSSDLSEEDIKKKNIEFLRKQKENGIKKS